MDANYRPSKGCATSQYHTFPHFCVMKITLETKLFNFKSRPIDTNSNSERSDFSKSCRIFWHDS